MSQDPVPAEVIFFDLGHTLGEPRLATAENVLVGFDIYEWVPALLAGLQASGRHLGIISNTGNNDGTVLDSVLQKSGILGFFDDPLRIYSKDVGLQKDSPAIFRLAAERAGFGSAPGKCMFVGESKEERQFAMAAGLQTFSDPKLLQDTNPQLSEDVAREASRRQMMTQYTAMCQALAKHVKFNELSPVGPPQGSPFEAQQLTAVVQESEASMPRKYASAYAALLAKGLPNLTRKLEVEFTQAVQQGQNPEEVKADIQSLVDTLVGAVRDWNEPSYRAALRRFEAVISNLYRSFLSAAQRTSVPLPLIETVPPLATFAPTPDQGPFTLPADAVKDLIGVPIGVVSLPGSYRDHPLVWPALAYECGGHDVLHADPGLLKELAAGVAQLPRLPRGIGRLWAGWMDEAASDVYGLLNIGPAFAVSLAAFFSALRASQEKRSTSPLGPISNVLPVQGNAPIDVHPVDLLRVHLAIGATAQLTSLSATAKTAWLTELADLATEAAGGATTIDIIDIETKSVVQRLPLEPMAEAAQAVGGYIATARLVALDGHGIQDIETWDDLDERAAQTVRQTAATGKSVVGLGDDAQLLAGTTLALLDDAGSYDAITGLLAAALDDSFARDPEFAPPAPFFMLIAEGRRPQGKAYSRTPAFPTFPLEGTGLLEQERLAEKAPSAENMRTSRRSSETGSSRRGRSK